MQDRMTGKSRGFAFVTMGTPEEAKKAIEMFNGKQVGGRALTVNEARPREERAGGGGGGGGGGQADTTPPTAAITATQKDPSGLFFDIDITYTDNVAVDVTQNGQQSNIGNGDIQVSGPDQLRNATLRFITTVSRVACLSTTRIDTRNPSNTPFSRSVATTATSVTTNGTHVS